MDYSKFSNSIFIVKDESKESIIRRIHSEKLLNIKIITLSELKKKYCFDYGKEAVYAVSKKYNVIGEIAKIYIDNVYYVKDIDDDKVKFLSDIKSFLVENELVTYNKLFHSFLKNKKIVMVDLDDVDKFYVNIFNELKKYNEIIKISTLGESTIKKLYNARDMEEEVAFVASSICNLIKSGVDINSIKLANVQSNYIFTIKKIFKIFNIPVVLPSESVMGSTIVDKFIELYDSDMSKCFEELKGYIKSSKDKKVYERLIQLVNKYAWCNDYNDVKDFVVNDLSNIKVPVDKLKNAVSTIDFENEVLDDEYIFLLNFNLGIIPICAKDEDYFDNATRRKLGISDTIEINEKRIANVQNRIRGAKNLIVTYSLSDLDGRLYISNAYDENDFEEHECKIDYTSSNTYNKIRLVSAKDEYKKFGTVNAILPILSFNYKDAEYESYKNDFKGINNKNMFDYIGNKLTLSYSSVDTYYKCAFRYYLENIIHLSDFETKIETVIGNIFHKVLSKCYKENFNLDVEYDRACVEEEYEFDAREEYFLKKLKVDLANIIDTIKIQEDYTLLKNKLFERRVIVPIDEKNNVEFKGFVDKIMYEDFDNKRIAAIIDYKTGDASINLQNVEYGLSLQLPAYAYLLRHIREFKEAKIGGFYLQKLFDDEKLKLSGYSNADISILEKVDTTYQNSLLINGIKVGSNGIYQNAKVLTDSEMDALCDLVESKIKEASIGILSAKFEINPKEINNINVGCKYCTYKSICYMKNADIVKLGGDSDAEVDE